MEDRIRNDELKSKIVSADVAALLIKDGMHVGTSGFTPSGYPKAVPLALAKRVRETGEKLKIALSTGASVGDELDGELAKAGIISRRLPYQTNNFLRDCINEGTCEYTDLHLSHTPQYIRYGFLGKMDVAIVEAVAITEDGHIVPSTSIGNSQVFVEMSDSVIVEINTSQPIELEGMSDIYVPENPPNRKPIPIETVSDRVGTPYIKCEKSKIRAIVITDMKDDVRPFTPIDSVSEAISDNLLNFIKTEVKLNRLPENLLPLQSGVGSVANAVLAGLLKSDFENLTCYTEVIQDSMLELIEKGKVVYASGTSISPSPEYLERFKNNISFFKNHIVLRPQEISNSPEVVRRLGVISINTAIEADIYGNVNSTHIMGGRMMNGIGGSGDYARNAYLSIFTTPSTAKGGSISSIVPMVSHHDHVDQDVMVIITEFGVADLRGKSPKEKAKEIILKCAHPDYRGMLEEYFEKAMNSKFKHTPQVLGDALSWHERFLKTGSMKI